MRKTTEQIEKLFYPKSVAVVGANRVRGTVPHDILYNILKDGYQGIIYPVSPRERSIAGVKAYKYVIDIEDQVDMAVLVFPSSVCHLAMEQCGQKGIKSAIIISAGFKEVGGIGVEQEKRIKKIADKYGISFIGPNCLGMINTDPTCHINASFARNMPEEGSIAFLSQSGALCTAVLDYAQAKHIGFSKFISFGNKADVSEIDLLYYLKDDRKTKVILLYLEEVSDGRALIKAASDIIEQSGKPILILKSGRTAEGARAAASHTGSLAGSDRICDAAFRQAGIIRCDTIDDLFNFAIGMAYQPLPADRLIAIITNAGGPGVLVTDMAVKEKLALAEFSADTTKILKKSLPRTANIKNPVDVIGDARADRYRVALTETLKDDHVAGALVILTPQSMTDIRAIAEEVCGVSGKYGKPVYASFMGEADVAIGVDLLQRRSIPHYQRPEDMCRSLARAYGFGEWLKKERKETVKYKVDQKRVQSLVADVVRQGRSQMTEYGACGVLAAYGLPVPRNGMAVSEQDALKLAQEIGYPVVMKAVSNELVHKSDVGAVALNIQDASQAKQAYLSIHENVSKNIPGAEIDGMLVRKWIEEGQEVILGLKRDNSFGPVIMVGLGGIFVEIFEDVTFRMAPVSTDNASAMIREIKSYPLLAGARGRSEFDTGSIEDCIQRLSQLAVEVPEIRELDINPLIVHERGRGCSVADVRILV